jgi:hypothetical protein
MIWLLAHPFLSFPPVCRLSSLLTGGGGGGKGVGDESIRRRRDSLVLYKSCNTLWVLASDKRLMYRGSNNNFSYSCHCDSRREGKGCYLVYFTTRIRIRVRIFHHISDINSLIFTSFHLFHVKFTLTRHHWLLNTPSQIQKDFEKLQLARKSALYPGSRGQKGTGSRIQIRNTGV